MRNRRKSDFALAAIVIGFVLALVGCESEPPEPVRVCPGTESVEQALARLRRSSRNLDSFVAYGSGRVSFYPEDKDKPRNERIPTVKLWFKPPGNLRFWGDVAFNARGIDLGSNENEFWFAGKPKEIGNIYIWGRWDEQNDADMLLLSPKILRQALGVIETDPMDSWSLSNDGRYDIISGRDESYRLVKRVYVETCTYNIRRIEYFGRNGALTAALELGDYMDEGGITVPAEITIIKPNEDGTEDTFEIVLKSIKPSDSIKNAVFERPSSKGFGEVYRMIKGRAIEQSK